MTAIVCQKLSTGGRVFMKYHNVRDDPAPVRRFLKFLDKYNGKDGKVTHINFYSKETREFMYQKRLDGCNLSGFTE